MKKVIIVISFVVLAVLITAVGFSSWKMPFEMSVNSENGVLTVSLKTKEAISYANMSLAFSGLPNGVSCQKLEKGKDADSYAADILCNPQKGLVSVVTTDDNKNTSVKKGKELIKAEFDISMLTPGDYSITLEFTAAADIDGKDLELKGKSIKANFTVAYSLTLSDTEIYLIPSEEYKLTAESYPPDLGNLSWKSSEEKIVEVDNEGNLLAKKTGTAVISVNNAENNLSAECIVNVEFSDVRDNQGTGSNPYYFTPVYWAVDKGITNGFTDEDGYARNFGPQQSCTREQMMTFLWRLAGKKNPKSMVSPFSDVKKENGKYPYYYKAVLWAAEKGITKGYTSGKKKGTFGVGETVTREDCVTFLYRAAGKPKVKGTTVKFSDVDDNKYYSIPIAWANSKGIAKGYKTGNFGVGEDCLREHIVTFMYRYDTKK